MPECLGRTLRCDCSGGCLPDNASPRLDRPDVRLRSFLLLQGRADPDPTGWPGVGSSKCEQRQSAGVRRIQQRGPGSTEIGESSLVPRVAGFFVVVPSRPHFPFIPVRIDGKREPEVGVRLLRTMNLGNCSEQEILRQIRPGLVASTLEGIVRGQPLRVDERATLGDQLNPPIERRYAQCGAPLRMLSVGTSSASQFVSAPMTDSVELLPRPLTAHSQTLACRQPVRRRLSATSASRARFLSILAFHHSLRVPGNRKRSQSCPCQKQP